MDITFSDLITPAGCLIAGGLVTTLIEILKTTFPTLDARVSGAVLAFVGSAILYVVALFAIGLTSPDVGLSVFVAWLTCAAAAVGIKSVTTHIQDVQSKSQ